MILRRRSVGAGANGRRGLRLLALVFCILFVALSLFAEIYILTHANHQHDHLGENGSCATCTQLTAAASLLTQVSAAAAKTAAIGFSLFAVLSLLQLTLNHISIPSPVALKVKLNY
jgi:heme/copper-type cytochrome/quinol oxidase subunit 4